MRILNTELKRLEPIPQAPYDKMKEFLYKHASLHCFIHSIYCRLTLGHYKKPYTEFLEESKKLK